MTEHSPERDEAYVAFSDSLPVYFAYSEALNLVKIGFSSNVRSRLATIPSSERRRDFNPGKPVLIGWMLGGPQLEAELHERFSAHSVRGEWFRPAPEMADFLDEESDLGDPPVVVSPEGFRASARGYWAARTRLAMTEEIERVVHDFGDGRAFRTRQIVTVGGVPDSVSARFAGKTAGAV